MKPKTIITEHGTIEFRADGTVRTTSNSTLGVGKHGAVESDWVKDHWDQIYRNSPTALKGGPPMPGDKDAEIAMLAAQLHQEDIARGKVVRGGAAVEPGSGDWVSGLVVIAILIVAAIVCVAEFLGG